MKPRNTARGGVQGGCPCGGGTEPRTCPQRSCRISAHEGPWVSGLVGREGLEPCFGAAFTQKKSPHHLPPMLAPYSCLGETRAKCPGLDPRCPQDCFSMSLSQGQAAATPSSA
ncbi:uncharacterized protein LOC119521955 isoform X3 [Choloepus didactylus]|uniref:uncharacterized protein LOC119521955 isoform X3 n=1 Tax=Choloepus didactylus TaxID=27675 RepID=UPI00189FA4D2|nr:uncharacterized protein LOC119521955 isoform X3 [Choloepus didactylus]